MFLGLFLLGLVATSESAGGGSCSGRCGEAFSRGQKCACDLNCLQHNECCPDFKAVCSPAKSCRARCGETMRRGQPCHCHPLCGRYNTCCHDYKLHCDAKAPHPAHPQRATTSGKKRSNRKQKNSNSESEEKYTGSHQQKPVARCQSSSDSKPAVATNHLQHGMINAPGQMLLFPNYVRFPSSGSALLNHGAPSLTGSFPVKPPVSGALGSGVNVQFVMSPGGLGPNQGNAAVFRPRPNLLQDVAQILGFTLMGRGFERPGPGIVADVHLCDDTPINGLTSLNNGTILIFKGEYFWSVDPVDRVVGLPQSITDTLGVLSPIDTVFTRFDCLNNTYIIKGDQIWRLDVNMLLEPGYPKPLTAEFPGLTGGVSAALVVPATRSTPETVFFFKPGDILQRFTFPPGNDLSCNKPPQGFLYKQEEVPLSVDTNITVTLKDFPVPVTSALTVQSTERYEHYIFTGPLFFSVQISNNLPVPTQPDPAAVFAPTPILVSSATQSPDPPQPTNSIRVWLRCT